MKKLTKIIRKLRSHKMRMFLGGSLFLCSSAILANSLSIEVQNDLYSCKTNKGKLTVVCNNGIPSDSLSYEEAKNMFDKQNCVATLSSSRKTEVLTFNNKDNPGETIVHEHRDIVATRPMVLDVRKLKSCTISAETGGNLGCTILPGFEIWIRSELDAFGSFSIKSPLGMSQVVGANLIRGLDFTIESGDAYIGGEYQDLIGQNVKFSPVASLRSLVGLMGRAVQNNQCE